MAHSPVRRAALVTTLSCLLVALCESGGGPFAVAPTTAPTLMPTPANPAWTNAVCEKVQKNPDGGMTLLLEEAGCNVTSQQVRVAAVSVTYQPGIALAPTETCAMAVSGYLSSVCTPLNGTVVNKNDTDATCVIKRMNGGTLITIEEDRVHCDGSKKYFTGNVTTPSSYPMPTAQTCDFAVKQFKIAQRSNNYSCPSSTPTPEPTPGHTPAPTPKHTPAPTPGHTPAPTPGHTPAPTPGHTPAPTPGHTPAPTPGHTPSPTPAGSFCASSKWSQVDASLRSRYNNTNANTASKPSYLNNGLMLHGLECTPSVTGLSCYGQDYPLYAESSKWSPECQGTKPNGTSSEDSVFCPTMSDWQGSTIKQAMSFSYIREDLPWQGIWVAGGYIDAGFILGSATLGAKGTTPRCFWKGDADSDARDGGGCGLMDGTGKTSKSTVDDPAQIYENSCQETLFKGADKSHWKQLYQAVNNVKNCAIITNDVGASSADPKVKQYIDDLNKESMNPFDDLYVKFSSCAPNCPPDPEDNEVLIPCCNSIEVMQPDAAVALQNWPALQDLDIVAIFYVIRSTPPAPPVVPMQTKKKATQRMAELLAKATGKPPVPVVGIDQDLLVTRKVDAPNLFVCEDQAQAFASAGNQMTQVYV